MLSQAANCQASCPLHSSHHNSWSKASLTVAGLPPWAGCPSHSAHTANLGVSSYVMGCELGQTQPTWVLCIWFSIKLVRSDFDRLSSACSFSLRSALPQQQQQQAAKHVTVAPGTAIAYWICTSSYHGSKPGHLLTGQLLSQQPTPAQVRIPLHACLSGWCMFQQPAAIALTCTPPGLWFFGGTPRPPLPLVVGISWLAAQGGRNCPLLVCGSAGLCGRGVREAQAGGKAE